MTTATKAPPKPKAKAKPKATPKPKAKAKPKPPPSTLDHLQAALAELDKARAQAQDDARASIDAAADRIRDAVSELRDRASGEARELQDWLEHVSAGARSEWSRRKRALDG